MTPFLLALGVLAVFALLYWAVARPGAENGRWFWFLLLVGVSVLSFLEIVYSLVRAARRLS